jgi:hypothetical protein
MRKHARGFKTESQRTVDHLPEPVAKGSSAKERCLVLIMRVQDVVERAGVGLVCVSGGLRDGGIEIKINFTARDTTERANKAMLLTGALADAGLAGLTEVRSAVNVATLVVTYPHDLLDGIAP